MKKRVTALLTCFAVIVALAFSVAAATEYYRDYDQTSPNYASNSHISWSLRYDGYVQIRPNYNDQGHHAFRGRFTFSCWDHDNGEYVSTRYYTAYGQSQYYGNTYSKSKTVYDSFYDDPKTKFYYKIFWTLDGGPWPQSIGGGETE